VTYLLSLRPNGIHRKQRALGYSVTINLKLCGFNEDPQQYMPKLRKRGIFDKGEKRRLIMQVLKDADKPLSSREICLAILEDKDFDMSDRRRLNQTVTGIYIFLCREHEFNRISRFEGVPAKWLYVASNL